MNLPIVKIELSGMRQQVLHAFSDWQLQQDAMVRTAVEQVCTPENVQRLLNETVANELNNLIRESAESFFKYGEGREFVEHLVIAKLSQGIKSRKRGNAR